MTPGSIRWKSYLARLTDEQYAALQARRAAYKREYWQRPEVKRRRNERRRAQRGRA